jgi:hypothetical protein
MADVTSWTSRSYRIATVGKICREWHLSSAEDYTNMNYYNLCGNRSQHSSISKRGVGTYKKMTGMQDSSSQL